MATGIVALDWDGALRSGFLLADWARFLAKNRIFPDSSLNEIEYEIDQYGKAERQYSEIAASVPRIFAVGLAGCDVEAYQALVGEFVQSDGFLNPISSLAHRIFELLHESPSTRGIVVSGAPHDVLAAVSQKFALSEVFGVKVERRGTHFLPGLLDNPAIAARKAEIVRGLRQAGTILLAVGDSESDIPMLAQAQHRIIVGSAFTHPWERDKVNTLMLADNQDILPTTTSDLRSFLSRAGVPE